MESARALRCERGHVTCDDAAPNESELSEVEITILTLQTATDAYHSLLRSSRGIKFLLRKIEEARDEVQVSGSLSTELRLWLAPAKNWERISLLGKKDVLAALEKETEELKEKKGQVEENESRWRNDQRECSAIPLKDALDRIHRYETSNVRHRYKVEARLEKLQAWRRGNTKANSGEDSDPESHQDIQFCETKPTGSGEPQVREASARVATLQEQVAQEEGGVPPEVDPIESPTNEIVAAAESAVPPAAEQAWCPTDGHTP